MRAKFALVLLLLILPACAPSAPPPTASVTIATSAPTPTLAPTPTWPEPTAAGPIQVIRNACGGIGLTNDAQLVADTWTTENGGLKSNFIRTITPSRDGLWVGYLTGEGVSIFDGTYWHHCQQMPLVNDIVVDEDATGLNLVWVATDGGIQSNEDGVWVYNPEATQHPWRQFDPATNTLNYPAYDINLGDPFKIWVANWEGVLNYNGKEGMSILEFGEHNLFSNHIHSFLHLERGDIWAGSISDGISWLHAGEWHHLTADSRPGTESVLGGNAIRDIAYNEVSDSVWIATEDGGVISYSYSTQRWQVHSLEEGLPEGVLSIAFFEETPFIATSEGAFFLDQDGVWQHISIEPALDIAFGCEGCVFGPEGGFVTTDGWGIRPFRVEKTGDGLQVLTGQTMQP